MAIWPQQKRANAQKMQSVATACDELPDLDLPPKLGPGFRLQQQRTGGTDLHAAQQRLQIWFSMLDVRTLF